MPRFLIERTVKGAGELTAEQLTDIAKKSNEVITGLGSDIQWVASFVNADRLMCHYIARDADIIKEHAKRGGFPCDNVQEIESIIDPLTADGSRWS